MYVMHVRTTRRNLSVIIIRNNFFAKSLTKTFAKSLIKTFAKSLTKTFAKSLTKST